MTEGRSNSVFGISYDANGSSIKRYLGINSDGSINIGSMTGDFTGSIALDPGDIQIGAVEIKDNDTGSRLDIVSSGAITNYLGAQIIGGTNQIGSVHVTEIDVVDSVTNLAAGSVQLNQGANEIGSVHITHIDAITSLEAGSVLLNQGVNEIGSVFVTRVDAVTNLEGGSVQLQPSTDEIGSVHVTRVDAVTNLEGGSIQLNQGDNEIGSVHVTEIDIVDSITNLAAGSIQLNQGDNEIGSVHVTRVDAITNLEGGSVQLQSGIAEIGSVSVQGYEAVDAASTMNPIITGRVAESTVPTEVSDGDVVKSWTDTFGRQVLKGFNLGQEALDVNEVAPALLQTMTQTGITQLTAAGSTADINVEEYGVYGYTYTVAAVGSAVGSSVTVELQGSIDGTNWCTLPIDNTAVQRESITINQVNVDQDGTYIIYSSAPVVYTHFNWTAEDGTTATIDADFFARRK